MFGDAYSSIDTREQEVKGYRLDGGKIVPLEVTVEKKEPLRAELESFLDCVRYRKRPIVSGEDGLAAVDLAIRVADAIEESMQRWRAGTTSNTDPSPRAAGRGVFRNARWHA